MRYSYDAPSVIWARIPGSRAEALDHVVYALAVRNLVGVDLTARADEWGQPRRAHEHEHELD